jgi:hypothetical protein
VCGPSRLLCTLLANKVYRRSRTVDAGFRSKGSSFDTAGEGPPSQESLLALKTPESPLSGQRILSTEVQSPDALA